MAKTIISAKAGVVVDARHEAAHAVAAVRLNLPLDYTTIRKQVVAGDQGAGGRRSYSNDTAVSVGYTTLVEGSAQAWADALPDPVARERLEALAIQCAAGPAADAESGIRLGDVSHQGDLQGLLMLARNLGIGHSTDEAPVREWMAEQCLLADALLSGSDDGAAWDRVRVALARKRHLTGDEVRALVGESDMARGEQPWHCMTDVAKSFLDQLLVEARKQALGQGAEGGDDDAGRMEPSSRP